MSHVDSDDAGRGLSSAVAGCIAICVALATPAVVPNMNGITSQILHIGGGDLDWVADAGFLAAAGAAYLFGSIADRVGRKRVLLLCGFFIVLGELLSGVAGNVHTLWAGQAIGGIGFGGMGAVSLATVVQAARNPEQRAKYLAAFSASFASGFIVASLIAGYLGKSNYKGAYLGMAAVAAGATILIALLCGESRSAAPRPLDPLGQLTLILTVGGLLWGMIEGSDTTWSSTSAIIGFAVAACGLVAFVALEHKPGGLIEFSVFRSPSFATAALVALVGNFAFVGFNFTYSIRLTVGQGHTVLFAAAGLILEGGVALAAGLPCRRLLALASGVRILVVGGMLAFVAADLWYLLTPIGNRSFGAMVGCLILTAAAQTATTAGVSAAAITSVTPQMEAVATSSQGVLRQLGQPLGIAIVGAVAFESARNAFAVRLPRLGLSAAASHGLAQINATAGILGVFHAPQTSTPAVAHAAIGALSHGFNIGMVIVLAVAAVMAGTALLTLADHTTRGVSPTRLEPASGTAGRRSDPPEG